MDQKNNTFIATKNVSTIMTSTDDPVLVKAGRAEGGADAVVYTGKVELWRGEVYVKADRIDASQSAAAQQNSHVIAEALPGNQVRSYLQTIRATSDKLDFDDNTGIIHYTGHVHAQKQDMILDTPDMVVNSQNNKVTDMVASGGVVVTWKARTGTGDRAVYEAATDAVTLTGKNAKVRDKKDGLVQGAKLLMKNKGETDVVESGNGDRTQSSHSMTSQPAASRPPASRPARK
jgi:lipopolysaccharide transport protein LptA